MLQAHVQEVKQLLKASGQQHMNFRTEATEIKILLDTPFKVGIGKAWIVKSGLSRP